jgi:hypothetical protein
MSDGGLVEVHALIPLLEGDVDTAADALAVLSHQELVVVVWAAETLAELAKRQIVVQQGHNRAARHNEKQLRERR